jgi:hypothetical protein
VTARGPDAARVHVAGSRARQWRLPATLTRAAWTQTVADFGGRCAFCDAAPATVLEHYVPIARGGGTTPGNCLPACVACDDRKRAKPPEALPAIFGAARVAALRMYLAQRSTGPDVATPVPDPKRVRYAIAVPISSLEGAALDAWAADLAAERGSSVSRAEVVREALTRALRERA